MVYLRELSDDTDLKPSVEQRSIGNIDLSVGYSRKFKIIFSQFAGLWSINGMIPEINTLIMLTINTAGGKRSTGHFFVNVKATSFT